MLLLGISKSLCLRVLLHFGVLLLKTGLFWFIGLTTRFWDHCNLGFLTKSKKLWVMGLDRFYVDIVLGVDVGIFCQKKSISKDSKSQLSIYSTAPQGSGDVNFF